MQTLLKQPETRTSEAPVRGVEGSALQSRSPVAIRISPGTVPWWLLYITRTLVTVGAISNYLIFQVLGGLQQPDRLTVPSIGH